MGNQLQKQYNIKSKPLKLPGAYTFLRFTYHPTLPQSIFIIKSPHKATLLQSSTLILPILQIKDFSSSNDSFAISPKCIPLALLKPKSQTQMKILMYKILKTGSEIGRCFLCQGRVMVWCEEKRSLSGMAPEEIQHGKYSEKSNVFTSGMSLLNFLAAVNEERPVVSKKDQKKKKQNESKSQKHNLNQSQQKPVKQPQPLAPQQTYTAQTLPQQIKLFFDPKQPRQYFQQLQGLPTRLQHTKFWQSVSQGLRQLMMNMLSKEPSSRVELETILGIPYFQSDIQVKLYFMLADGLEGLEKKEMQAFMRALEMIVKIGTVIEQQILEDYFVPVLVAMATVKSQPISILTSYAISILIQTPKPPLQVIFNAFRKSPATDLSMSLLCLEKKQKLYYLFQQQRFDSIMSRMLFCSYQSEELIKLAVMSTGFVMQSMKEEKFRKEVEFKLVTRVLGMPKDKQNKVSEQLLVCGLKCAIQLIKHSHCTSLKPFTQLTFHPLTLSLQANIHILYLYRLLSQNLPTKLLFPLMMPKLQAYLSQPQISDELFTTAHKLAKKILDRLYEQRKLLPAEDDMQLEYSEEYFVLKDELGADGRVLEEECKKLKVHIEKQEFGQIGWIATEIF